MKTVKAWFDKWREQFGNVRDSDDVLLVLQSENDVTISSILITFQFLSEVKI